MILVLGEFSTVFLQEHFDRIYHSSPQDQHPGLG